MKLKYVALILENSKVFIGKLIGDIDKQNIGEIVFNTSMSGYQEIITDPSYKQQLVCFTYPSIGNYGINAQDNESDKPYLSGIIIKDYCEMPSNFQSIESLDEYLKRYKIPGIYGIDTRHLVKIIRDKGSMKGGIFLLPEDGKFQDIHKNTSWIQEKLELLNSTPSMEGQNLVSEFNAVYANQYCQEKLKSLNTKQWSKVAVLDFGIKLSILDSLIKSELYPIVFPGDLPISQWANFEMNHFDSFFLSNGPGDPAVVKNGIANAKIILESKKPILGICLGHQILSLALGGSTYKLKFGHHGGNQPVGINHSGEFLMTAQNHGFATNTESLENLGFTFTSIEKNLNDLTIEGFTINTPNLKVISVQYHPEGGPGPNDAKIIFQKFKSLL